MSVAAALTFQICVAQESAESCRSSIAWKRAEQLKDDTPRSPTHLLVTEDGKTFVVEISDGALTRLIAYNLITKAVILDKKLDAPLSAIASDTDGQQLAVGYQQRACEGAIRLQRWNLRSGDGLAPLESKGERSDLRLFAVNALTYSGDGQKLIASNEGEIRIWNAASGRNLSSFEPPGFERRTGIENINFLRTNHDGSLIVGAGDTSGLLWRNGKLIRSFGSFTRGSVSAAFLSPDETMIVVEGSMSNVYSVASGKVLASFPESLGLGKFSTKGDFILFGHPSVQAWSPKTGKLTPVATGDRKVSLMTGTDRILGVNEDMDRITLFDLQTKELLLQADLPARDK